MNVKRSNYEICDLTIKAAGHKDGRTGRWYLYLRLEDGSGLRQVFHMILMDATNTIGMDNLMAALVDDISLFSIIRNPEILIGRGVHAMIHEEEFRDVVGWRVHHLYPNPRNFAKKEAVEQAVSDRVMEQH